MSFFQTLNFKLDLSELFNDIKKNNLTWKIHGHNMPTAVLPEFYENELRKIINIEENRKIYVHNLLPVIGVAKKDVPYLTGWHTDNHRLSSILIQVSDDNPNHYAEFRKGNLIEKAPYTQGVPLLFNVKEIHRVQNKDSTLARNMISIQYQNTSYNDLVDMHKNQQLINYDNFENNFFKPVII